MKLHIASVKVVTIDDIANEIRALVPGNLTVSVNPYTDIILVERPEAELAFAVTAEAIVDGVYRQLLPQRIEDLLAAPLSRHAQRQLHRGYGF
jgi:hypothetical protein